MRKDAETLRNSSIEALRFLCASAIIFGHIKRDLKIRATFFTIGDIGIRFFPNSNQCVEFFFMVTGFFLARTCYSRLKTSISDEHVIAEETTGYLWRKLKRILPYYIPANLIVAFVMFLQGDKIIDLLWRLPSLFFLHRTGISENFYLSVSWYLSSMIIAVAIIYPVCRKHYHIFTTCIAPVGALLIAGAIIKNTGTLGEVAEWSTITYKCNLRAIADISLGTTCFEICRRLSNVDLSAIKRLLLSLTAGLFTIIVAIYICSDISQEKSGIMLVLIAVIITILMSQKGMLGGHSIIYDNKCFNYLGAISLPMYLMQNLFRILAKDPFDYLSNSEKALFIYCGTVVSAVVMHFVITHIKHYKQKISQKTKAS